MNVVARKLLPLMRGFTSRATPSNRPSPDLLFLQWLCFTGLLMFAAFLLWRANVWGILVNADPTGITMMIVCVFFISTIWVGLRALALSREQQALDA